MSIYATLWILRFPNPRPPAGCLHLNQFCDF